MVPAFSLLPRAFGADQTQAMPSEELLLEIRESGSMAVVMGLESSVKLLKTGLPSFKKELPWEIHLPTVTIHCLARITYQNLQQQGYILRRSLTSKDEMSIKLMEFVVRQTHDPMTIKERNWYLARDMMRLAISRKNDRRKPKFGLYAHIWITDT